MKKVKKRLDQLLVERGLADTMVLAQALIMAGEVHVENCEPVKSGMRFADDTVITLKVKNPYVSRGGLKLAAALEQMKIDVRDRICMDIGASTGGFTDCLLQHGARKVYAIDVGAGLLDPKLRNDPRVVTMENINFRYFPCENLKEPVQFATIDVSFISLAHVVPSTLGCLSEQGQILALVKPQFEAPARDVVKGVVRDEKARIGAIESVRRFMLARGLTLKGEMDSPVKGPQGNVEHFFWLTK